ncbi:MAG: hypothetical protein Q8R28_02375 [Dehalococcoidia bacterium]|nr:hypothetical protein [Dehalococcoidia bacterium]
MAKNRDIHTKKDKKLKKESKKQVKIEPLIPVNVEVVHKHRKETVPE